MSRKIFLVLHVRPEKHLALTPCSRTGISIQSVCCRLLSTLSVWLCAIKALCSWHISPMCAEAQQLFQQSHWRALVKWSFAEHTGSACWGREGRKLCPRIWNIPSAWPFVPWSITPDASLSHTLFSGYTITVQKASQQTWFSCDVCILSLSPWVLLRFLILIVLGTWRYLTPFCFLPPIFLCW